MDRLEYCRILRIEADTLQAWIEERWIVPHVAADAESYEDIDIARGRLILDLVHTMGVNDAGVDIVVDLVDQIHGLRERMRLLVDAVKMQDVDAQRTLARLLRDRAGGRN